MAIANGASVAEFRARDDSPIAPVPQNLSAEEAVLGALLSGTHHERAIAGVLELGLTAADFYRPGHGAIFGAISALYERRAGVDKLTVSAEMSGRGDEAIAIAIDLLSAAPPFVGHVRDYAQIVIDTAYRRRRHTAALKLLSNTSDDGAWESLLLAAEPPVKIDRYADRELDLAKIMDEPDSAIPWRCDEFVADGHLTMLVGGSGEGKSMLTLAMAKAVQEARKEAGISCRLGRVVIFDAENGKWVLRTRLKSAQIPIADLKVFDSAGIDLRSRRDQQWILEKSEGADLVVWDSLRMMTPGAKENDSDDMAPAVAFMKNVCRETGAAGIGIHHAGWDGRSRGSTAIKDQTDLMFDLIRHPEDPLRAWRRSLRCAKCRIGAEPHERWFGIKGSPRTNELFFTEAEPFDKEDPEAQSPVKAELRPQIIELIRSNGPTSRPDICRHFGRPHTDKTIRAIVKEWVEADVLVEAAGNKLAQGGGFPKTPQGTQDTPQGVPLKGRDTETPMLEGLE